MDIRRSNLHSTAIAVFRVLEAGVLVAVERGELPRTGLSFGFGYADDRRYVEVYGETAGTLENPPLFRDTLARKNALTAEHGMPIHLLLAEFPELAGAEDTQYEGNAFCPVTGLIVGCSAALGRTDRGFAEAGLALWKAGLGVGTAQLITVARALKTGSIGDAAGLVPVAAPTAA